MMYIQFMPQLTLSNAAMLATVLVACACERALLIPIRTIVASVSTLPVIVVLATAMHRLPGCVALPVAKQPIGVARIYRSCFAALQAYSYYMFGYGFAGLRARVLNPFTFATATYRSITPDARPFNCDHFATHRTSNGCAPMFSGARAAAKERPCVWRQALIALEYLAAVGACPCDFVRHSKAPYQSDRYCCRGNTASKGRSTVYHALRDHMSVLPRQLHYSTFTRPLQPFSALGGGKWRQQ